jgi:hypothetical protein
MSVARSEIAAFDDSSGKSSRKPLIAGFNVHRVGVSIDKHVDQRTWYEFGKLLQQIDYAREWVLADWLAFGEHKYGDKIYQSAARLLGKSPRTWEDYAYIARNVRTSERSEILPALVHKPVARFGDKPSLQRKLIALAEEHGLSKAVFELVIELYLDKQPYEHLLAKKIAPVDRARLRAEKERERVLKRAGRDDGKAWIEYAREQAKAWQRVVTALESTRARGSVPRSGNRSGRPRAVQRGGRASTVGALFGAR